MRQRDNKSKKMINQRAFSIVELIVSVGLFAIILVAITGTLLSVVKVNKQAVLMKSLMNNVDFAVENMTREIRTGREYDCGQADNIKNCSSNPESEMSFNFQGQIGPRVTYKLDNVNHQILKKIGSENFSVVTSPDIIINRLNFYVSGVGDNQVQPSVLIVVGGEAKYKDNVTKFNIESLAVQRLFNK